MAGYPFWVMSIGIRGFVLCYAMIAFTGNAWGQAVAFVAPGTSPTRAASRAVLRCHELLEDHDELEVSESAEMRRALAGMSSPSSDDAEDPLSDVRRLIGRAHGDRLGTSLHRLGDRLGVDLLFTVRQVGEELELRGFNVEQSTFYRGTLMMPAFAPPDYDEVSEFVLPRIAALDQAVEDDGRGAASSQRRRRLRSRWWVWVLVGSAAAAAVLLTYLVQPDEVEDTGVTLRIVAP